MNPFILYPLIFGFVCGLLSTISNKIENKADRIGVGIWAVLVGFVVGWGLAVLNAPIILLLAFLSLPAGTLLSKFISR